LDDVLCEFELPPVPPSDVFDARWGIPLRNGILRNIYPAPKATFNLKSIYKAQFQAGGVAGTSSALYPVKISWKPEEIPAIDDITRNPAGSSWYIQDFSSNGNYFSFNMRTPDVNNKHFPDVIAGFTDGTKTVYEITITNRALTDFVIVLDWITGVNDATANVDGIISVNPNPIDKNASISYGLTKSNNVRIDVIDELGNIVSTLYEGYLSAGTYNFNWDGTTQSGSRLASGAYTLRMLADGNLLSVKSIVLVH